MSVVYSKFQDVGPCRQGLFSGVAIVVGMATNQACMTEDGSFTDRPCDLGGAPKKLSHATLRLTPSVSLRPDDAAGQEGALSLQGVSKEPQCLPQEASRQPWHSPPIQHREHATATAAHRHHWLWSRRILHRVQTDEEVAGRASGHVRTVASSIRSGALWSCSRPP